MYICVAFESVYYLCLNLVPLSQYVLCESVYLLPVC